jgi:hypothetical protein
MSASLSTDGAGPSTMTCYSNVWVTKDPRSCYYPLPLVVSLCVSVSLSLTGSLCLSLSVTICLTLCLCLSVTGSLCLCLSVSPPSLPPRLNPQNLSSGTKRSQLEAGGLEWSPSGLVWGVSCAPQPPSVGREKGHSCPELGCALRQST